MHNTDTCRSAFFCACFCRNLLNNGDIYNLPHEQARLLPLVDFFYQYGAGKPWHNTELAGEYWRKGLPFSFLPNIGAVADYTLGLTNLKHTYTEKTRNALQQLAETAYDTPQHHVTVAELNPETVLRMASFLTEAVTDVTPLEIHDSAADKALKEACAPHWYNA